jgi:GalNAc-alpha-(1->4)-GalNAc-alpha-(1->3)-diNAcBac-PP-undecaprenol alpha-1,4-N-acetyl-D-galactosaminyltransferase
MRVMCVTRELNGVMGGLERQILMISDGLANLGANISVVSIEKAAGTPFFPKLEDGVNFETIIVGDPSKAANFKTRFLRQTKLLRIVKEFKPDVIVTFMIGSFIFAKPVSSIMRIPVVLSERNSPDIYQLTSAKRLKWVYFLIMASAHKITVQFPSYIEKYPFFLRRKIVSIPNQVPQVRAKNVDKKDGEIVFGYAGRFSFQKRIDILIHSFSKLNRDFPNTKLLIFGYGEQQKYLEGIVSELNLTNKVEFREERSQISEILDEIDVFCLFSLWEGFPNVLAEALAYGVPSAGFSSCDGVNDLIQDGINGWKIPINDPIKSGYQLLARAYQGFKLQEVSKESCQESVSRFSTENIYGLWRNLLAEVSRQ